MRRTSNRPWLALAILVAFLGHAPGLTAQDEPTPPIEDQIQASEPEIEGAEPAPTSDPVSPSPQAPATPSGMVDGVTSAARDTAAEVVGQGKSVWTDVLKPIWGRMAAAVPALLKALALLLAFWLLALLVSGLVRRLLGLTRADERAATDWGLGSLLRTKDGQTRSIERLVSTAVKWLILLFGFVAFFQALDLSMVAAPLERVIARIVGVVPNLLQATVILAVYWVLATIVRMGAEKGLGAVGFDQRASRFLPEREVDGVVIKPSGLVGRLVFYVVLLLGVAPFLDALGQRSLVAPLGDLLEKVLGFLPNLAGAALILFIGHLVGVVVREVLTNLVSASGADAGVRKVALGAELQQFKLSQVVGSVAYFFIIVPVVGAAVDALGIRALSEPVGRTLTTMLGAVPIIFVALVIAGLGYFLARLVRGIVQAFLAGIGVDTLPEKLGLKALKRDDARFAPSSVLSTAVMLVIILLTAEQALATLQLEELSQSISALIGFLPEIVVALAILLASWVIAGPAASLVETAVGSAQPARVLSAMTRYAILFFGAALAFSELGIGGELISVIVGSVVGATALAVGLAFGLGGKERARELIDRMSG